MSIKINNNITIKGVLNIEPDGRIIVSVEDIGDVPFDELVPDFDGREVTLTISCDIDGLATIRE